MALVLGIDAAWTAAGSSGVALLRCEEGKRRVIAVDCSYSGFISQAENGTGINWDRPTRGASNVARLLEAAKTLGCAPVDVVAIDMPIALTNIERRRAADNAISQKFGAAGAGTHTVNETRPGPFGKSISDGFRKNGFAIATASHKAMPALIEVFPLAALVRLMDVDKRPPYKVTKTSKYWPKRTRDERRDLLHSEWCSIFSGLKGEISEIDCLFPKQWSSWESLKPYEDVLDAVISALVGTYFLTNSAEAFGNSCAAIWVPRCRAAPLTP
jgi:predicted RNase H-like nuclease